MRRDTAERRNDIRWKPGGADRRQSHGRRKTDSAWASLINRAALPPVITSARGGCVADTIRTRLRRPVAPLSSTTRRFGTPNCFARNAHSAALAAPSTGGAVRTYLKTVTDDTRKRLAACAISTALATRYPPRRAGAGKWRTRTRISAASDRTGRAAAGSPESARVRGPRTRRWAKIETGDRRNPAATPDSLGSVRLQSRSIVGLACAP